eukprot:jgi/Bigna1/133222/aug1.20_g7930
MGLCGSSPDIEVEAPEVDMGYAMRKAKDSYYYVTQQAKTEKNKMKYPFTLHEMNDPEKTKITDVPSEEVKWVDATCEYLAALDEWTIKRVQDNVWISVVKPTIEPNVDNAVNGAAENVEGFSSLPYFIQSKAKRTAKDKAITTARKKSGFDKKIQDKMLSIALNNMIKEGATINPEFKPPKEEEEGKDEEKKNEA